MFRNFLKKPISASLSPNASWVDIRFALNALFPWNWHKWREGSSLPKLQQWFEQRYDVESVALFDSGRSALTAILRSLDLQEGDEVILQAFTCVVVPNAILAAAGTPVYIDIDQYYNLNPDELAHYLDKPNHRVKAVIVQHTFGIPAQIDRIREICNQHDIRLIEDCAHALGARINDQEVGTFGDAALFSFGRDKVISAVSGGAAIARHPEIARGIQMVHGWYFLPGHKWIAQRLFHPLVFAIAQRFYYVFSLGKVLISLSLRLGIIPLVLQPQEKSSKAPNVTYQFPNILAAWALSQLERLDEMNAHRRQIAKQYMDAFKEKAIDGYVLPEIPVGAEPIWLRFPVLLSKPHALLHELKGRGILLGDWYSSVVAPTDCDLGAARYTLLSMPWAERISARIVNLPNSPTTTAREADRVIEAIRSYTHPI